jgi:hypothetical protein
MAEICEHGSETSGSIKGEEFTDRLRKYQPLKYDSAPLNLLLS